MTNLDFKDNHRYKDNFGNIWVLANNENIAKLLDGKNIQYTVGIFDKSSGKINSDLILVEEVYYNHFKIGSEQYERWNYEDSIKELDIVRFMDIVWIVRTVKKGIFISMVLGRHDCSYLYSGFDKNRVIKIDNPSWSDFDNLAETLNSDKLPKFTNELVKNIEENYLKNLKEIYDLVPKVKYPKHMKDRNGLVILFTEAGKGYCVKESSMYDIKLGSFGNYDMNDGGWTEVEPF